MAIDFNKYPLKQKVRHHITSFNYLPIEELKYIPDTYPELIKSVEWENIYGNTMPPDIIDIGCGKGHFLLQMSEKYPNKNVLGIEIRGALVDWINDVAQKEELKNCHVKRYTVVNGLDFIDSNSVEKIFYLFPDPWPKTRHLKRRAFSNKFLSDCYRILKKGGSLNLATDVDYVNEFHIKLLTDFKQFDFKQISDEEWDYPKTNKEKFCIEKNIFVFRIKAIK